MNKKILFALWGSMFSICAALGFIPHPSGVREILLTITALAFFAPPAALLYGASKNQDEKTLLLVRNLSALSLGLTMVLLIVNFLTALSSEALGSVVYYILVIVSSPMVCSGHWALSLFLWACLLMVSLRQLRK